MAEDAATTAPKKSIFRFAPSRPERSAGAWAPDTLENASRALRTDGVIILDDVVDVSLIDAARDAFNGTYANRSADAKNAIKVGEKRHMMDVDLEPPFDDPALFANPWLLPILGSTSGLDRGFVIGNFGAVCSQPGADEQHHHRDGAILFSMEGIDKLLPPAAVTVAIPLLDMNAEQGTTALFPGTHRAPEPEGAAVEPIVPRGSVVLWDFRVLHFGTPNRSNVARPLMYLTYCRPWWIDHINFKRLTPSPIRARKGMLTGLSEEHQHLLARAEEF